MELEGDAEVSQQDWKFLGGMNKMKRQSDCNRWNFEMRRNTLVNLNLQGSHQFPLESSLVVVEEASIWRNGVSKKVCLVSHNTSTVFCPVEKRDRTQQPEMREATFHNTVVASNNWISVDSDLKLYIYNQANLQFSNKPKHILHSK